MFKRRREIILLLAVLSLFGGLYTGRALFYSLTYMFALVLIISFGWAWASLRYTSLSRTTRTRRTQVGQPLDEHFRVVNSSIIPKLWLEIRDASDVPAHQSSYVVNGLWGRARHSWRVSTICQQRGRYQLGPMLLRTSDPFGLYPMEKAIDITSNVVVYPLAFPIDRFVLPTGVLPGGEALRRRTHYVTTNAAGVRDYVPGDSFNRIHWASTARRNRLIVKEFELDPLADIWIIPDMSVYDQMSEENFEAGISVDLSNIPALVKRSRDPVRLPKSTEEYVIAIAASLTTYFIRHDRSVGLLSYGQVNEIMQPDRGVRHENRIYEALSVLRATGSMPIEDLILGQSRYFPRGSTVIAITPTTRPGWPSAARQLKQRGLVVVSILVDPQSFGGRKSNAGMADQLQGRGMGVYMVNQGDDLTAVLSQ